MRTNKNSMLLLLSTVLMTVSMFTVSCSNKDLPDVPEEKDQGPDVENAVYEIISGGKLTVDEMADSVFGPRATNFGASQDELQTMRRLFIQKQLKLKEKVANEHGMNGISIGWEWCDYKYQTIDELNNPIKLSARVCWGIFYYLIDSEPLDPDYIVLCPHFTIGANKECPTNKHTYEELAIVGDNLLVLPDYEGFGESKGRRQAYTNHTLQARQCMDALEAGYKVFKNVSGAKLEDDAKLYVVGASQGGGNALAIHKWLDTHPDVADKWKFEYSYCCAGPYDPALTFKKYFEQKKHPYPCVFPFVLKALYPVHAYLNVKWEEEDFYSEDFVQNHKALMDQLVDSKEYTCDELNKKFFEWYPHEGEEGIDGGSEIYLSDILNPELLDPNSDMYKALFKCLEYNSLTTDWTPTHKIKLYHGADDEIVPYANAEAVVAAFPDKTELFNSGWGSDGHIGTCIKWLLTVVINNW